MGRKPKGGRSSKEDSSASASTGPLELQESEDLEKKIARALRAKNPNLGEEAGEAAGAPYLAASFVAYAAERQPQLRPQWVQVLAEVLSDAGSVLDDDDNDDAVRSLIEDLISRRVLSPV